MADIIELVYADHDWLRRQFFRLDDAKSTDELAAVWDLLSDRLAAHADAEETVGLTQRQKLSAIVETLK